MSTALRHSLRLKIAIIVVAQTMLFSLLLLLYFPMKMTALSRARIEAHAKGLATVVGSAVGQGIEYNDAVYVEEILRGFRSTREVTYAVVKRADGTVLAAYSAHAFREVDLRPTRQVQTREVDGILHVVAAVDGGDAGTGTLAMGFTLAALEEEQRSNMLAMVLISLGVLVVGVVFAFAVGGYLGRPIVRMTEVVELVAKGDLTIAPAEFRSRDEVGHMAGAFDRMIAEQKRVVKEIADTARELGAAAAEIHAAAQEQEAAAGEQQVAVEEVARTMTSLLEAAGHIAESARGVLDNAEQTRQTTDLTSSKITELSSHTNRIVELLEVIRDIADRSDLLALNAALEATRAGEAGRSFSLVAAEMRRLAERVTASVQDVKALLDDVRASGASTVDATEQSRKLAEDTTESARQITMVTEQQQTGTEQASRSLGQFSEVLTQSVSATQQTRASAEELKRLADRLSELVGRFRVS